MSLAMPRHGSRGSLHTILVEFSECNAAPEEGGGHRGAVVGPRGDSGENPHRLESFVYCYSGGKRHGLKTHVLLG